MRPGVPIDGTAAQRFVIVLARILDDALQADVAPDFDAVMVEAQQRQQA